MLFWIGHLTSGSGRWAELTGAVWIVYELTGSPVLVGLLGLARAIPSIVLSPVAGVVADRVDQRRLLLATQVAGMLASLVLGLLIATGAVQVWHIYVQVAIQSGVMAFDAGVRQALFPRLIARQHLPEAVTLNSTANRTAQLIGPAAGGLAIAALGDASPFLINAATFTVLIAGVMLMRTAAQPIGARGSSFRGDLVEGLRHIGGSPLLNGLLRLEIVFSFFQVNPVTIAIVGRELLGVGPEGLGGLLSAPALGALVGVACLVLVGQPHRQGRFIVLCQLAYAGVMVALALSQGYLFAFVLLVVIGCLDALAGVTRHNVLQLAAPPRMRGRVMANMGTVTRGVTPLGQTQSGGLAGAVGPQLAVVLAAGTLVVAAAVVARANPRLWQFERDAPEPGQSLADVPPGPPPPRPA
jgi:MFS family permease